MGFDFAIEHVLSRLLCTADSLLDSLGKTKCGGLRDGMTLVKAQNKRKATLIERFGGFCVDCYYTYESPQNLPNRSNSPF